MKKLLPIAMTTLMIVLTGCSPELYTKYELKDPVLDIDEKMLLAQNGEPRWVIETTQLGGPPSYSYLYAGEDGCVNSYTINALTKQVSDYRCFK